MSGATWDLAAVLERAAKDCEDRLDFTRDGADDGTADAAILRAHAEKVRAYCEAADGAARISGHSAYCLPRCGCTEQVARSALLTFTRTGQ